MRRFSIRNLMGFVLAIAVAFAALRNADDYWAGGLLSSTALFIGIATLGAILTADRPRAGWLGFAVFGGGYFALAFLGLSESNLTRLPTAWLLTYVHQRVAPPQTFAYTITGPAPVQGLVLTANNRPGPIANTFTTTTTSQLALVNVANSNLAAPWGSLLPGAANYEAFSVVGHCLFALLAGLLGTIISRQMFTRQARRSEGHPSELPGQL
jgi:hypothetical protein